MKIAFLSAVLVAGGVGLYLTPGPNAQIDPFTSASIAEGPVNEFAIANLQTGSACIVTRGDTLTAKSRDFDAGLECESVWAGLSRAATWADKEDGSIALMDQSGHELLALSPGDGVAFEAFEPPAAQISLTALR